MRQRGASVRRKGKQAAKVLRIEGPARYRGRGWSANGTPRIVEPNLGECVFCDLRIHPAPGKVRVVKRYE